MKIQEYEEYLHGGMILLLTSACTGQRSSSSVHTW